MHTAMTNSANAVQKKDSTGTINIFLVDDHAIFRESLAVLLSQEPHFNVLGHSGDEEDILDRLKQFTPDVAILDLSMPQANGLDICKRIKQETPSIGVIVLTMHSDEQTISKAIYLGVSGYVLKGSGIKNLKTAIEVAFQGGTYLCPGIPKDILQNPQPLQDPLDSLSEREKQVLQMFTEGKTNKEMAEQLKLSPKTIDTYRRRVMQKLNMPTQSALMKYAVERDVRVSPLNQ